jgi:hypothetical protein
MEIPDVGTAPNEVPLSGQLGTMAFQDSAGVSVGQLEVTDKVDGTLNVESTDGLVASFERTGNAKLKVHSDANGPYLDTETGHNFRIFTNGGEAVRVDGSGQVGIGTSSPGSYNGDANDLVVGAAGTGNRGLTIASGSTNYGVIYFADGTTGNQQYRGAISYNHNSDSLSLSTSGTTRWSIGSGGVLLGAAGNGIRFDTGTTLDSYEEGTWTVADGSGAGLTFTYAEGTYIKVGGQVTCWARIEYPVTSDTTAAAVQGFPFPFGGSTVDRVGGPVVYTNYGEYISVLGVNSQSKIQIFRTTGSGPTNANLTGKQVWFTATYNVS